MPIWSGPVGLGRDAHADRGIGAGHGKHGSRSGQRAGCERPGHGRDRVEQAGIRLAGQHADEGGRPEAEGRAPARTVERERIERSAAGQDRDPGARCQRARLEVGQQARVLLGLLGDPVDGGDGPGLHLAQAEAGRPASCGLGVDRVAMRAGLGMTEHLIEASLDARRDRALETHRLVIGFGPAEPDDSGQQPLQQRVPPEDPVGGRSTGRREAQIATFRVLHEAIGDQPPEHLAGGLGGDPEVTGDLGGRDMTRIVGATHDPQREQVLLGRR